MANSPTLNDVHQCVMQDCTFYTDAADHKSIFVKFTDGRGIDNLTPLKSEQFGSYLSMTFQDQDGFPYYSPKTIVNRLQDDFNFNGLPGEENIYTRVSGSLRDGLEYDLMNNQYESVTVTPGGWQITPHKRLFKRFENSLPQVSPVKPASDVDLISQLSPFVNLKGDQLNLFAVWLVQQFIRSSHCTLIVQAKPGCGKTTLSKIIGRLIDPVRGGVTTLDVPLSDLQTILAGQYLVEFDNVSTVPKNVSDLLCQAVTGSAVTKRTLYTNCGLTTMELHNSVVLNGITAVPQEADLADRSLLLTLEPIKKYTTNDQLFDDFEKAKPFLLGTIFDVLSKAMLYCSTSVASQPSRMADSYRDMTAIANAIGIQPNQFEAIYKENTEQLRKARAHTPLVEAVVEYMNNRPARKAEGKVSVLYRQIANSYSGSRELLPKSASRFSQQLDIEAPALKAAGLKVNTDDTHADGTHMAIIRLKD